MKGIEIINASAGSGKTYSLTARVIEKLQSSLEPEALMATTFTNKAAAELRERIRLELLKNDRTNEAQRIFDGFVGTVNSICARLLTEYALEAGLSPALDVLPEEDSARLFNIAISNVINKHADAIEPMAKRLGRDGSGSKYQNADWREDVQRIVELARSNQLDSKDLSRCAEQSWKSISDLFGPPLDNDISAQFTDHVTTAIRELGQIEKPKKGTQTALTDLEELKRKIDRNIDIPWIEWIRISKLGTVKESEILLEEVKTAAANVLNHPGFQDDVRQVITGVFKCAADALLSYKIFKQKQGLMDFVDQETMVLDLARNNPAFRDSMRDRLQQMMVDEFQDTSPIQLALFLQLNELTGQSVWVGDPKQAIYGFRGTDPQLMEEVIKQSSGNSTLSKSWRSREALVQFCNAVFSEVFHDMGRDKVCLDIPDERKETAAGGWIESWNLPVKNNPDEAYAIANGVKDLLKRNKDIKPTDIAILCRKNDSCGTIAASLEALGIRASAAQGSLMDTKECRLAMAALRYMQDKRDTVALAEIVHLSHKHSDHTGWLASLVQDRNDAMDKWRKDPLVNGLDKARDTLKHRTPIEALENAISNVELIRTLKSWPGSAKRMKNLDLLRGVCIEYLDQCRARRSAATVAGFINYFQDAETGQAEGSGVQTVQVLTYHRAKGLEWPIVILTNLNSNTRSTAFGSDVVPAPVFDPSDPLADRSIHFWPWPFGSQKKVPELDNRLVNRIEEIRAMEKARKESNRLMYVGMTRARDGLIFAVRKKITKTKIALETSWLDELTDSEGNSVIKLPLQSGKHTLEIGGDSVDITVREYSEIEDDSEDVVQEQENYFSPIIESIPEYPPARISPSGSIMQEAELSRVKVNLAAELGERIAVKGKPDFSAVGNALHGFLGLDHPGADTSKMNDTASSILKRWGVDNSLTPSDMLEARERLHKFIGDKYPDAKVLCEWPITLSNAENQLMNGWIDMLLELPDGYVIIDHKSYPGADAEEHAKQYASQLTIYKEAIEKATGKDVVATLVHMPVVGKVFEVV